MIRDFFLLAVNSMKKRQLRSWLTLLGIFIGIAAVVALISLGSGLRTAITGQFGDLSADVLTFQNAGTGFGPPGSTVVRKINENDLKLIESTNGVEFAIPRLIRLVKVEYNGVLGFKYLASLPKEKEKIDFVYLELKMGVKEGRLLKPGERGKVVLGGDFTSKDEFGKLIRAGSKIKLQGKDFEVAGILNKGSSIIINSAILMNEEDMKELLNIEDEIDLIAIKVASVDQVEKVSKDLTDKFRRDRNEKKGEEDFTIQTPVQSLEAINTILNIVNIVVIGIASISLLIGGIGIANTMYTSILERTKEIGTMKAVGARNSDILKIFVIESGLFGLIGGISGVVFGLFLAFSVSSAAENYFGQNILIFAISWSLVIFAISFSFLIGVLAGLVPSWQASKLKPVDALRA